MSISPHVVPHPILLQPTNLRRLLPVSSQLLKLFAGQEAHAFLALARIWPYSRMVLIAGSLAFA
jgi:hypothetical protein